MRFTRSAVLLTCILIVAAALRVADLGKFSFGNDEIAEATWSALPFHDLMREVRRDGVHPPLDYVVHFVLARCTTREWVQRLPSVLAGVATVAAVACLATLWYSANAGLLAAFLLAINPTHIRFSQEMRPYALALAFVIGSLCALELHARTRSRRTAVVWFFAVLAAALTLYFAGMIALLVSVLRIHAGRREELATIWRRLPAIVLAWAIFYLPWLSVVIEAAGAIPPVARERLDWQWWSLRLQVLATGDWLAEPVTAGSWAFWLLVAVGIAATLPGAKGRSAIIWFVAGVGIEIAILQLRPHFPAPRHLLPGWLGAFLLAGAGGAWLLKTAARRLVLASAVFLLLISTTPTLRAYYDHGRPEWGRMVRAVAHDRRPAECVYVANEWTARNFGYYWINGGHAAASIRRLPAAPVDVRGPAWLVVTECPMSAEARGKVNALPRIGDFHFTNRGELRYLPAGERLVLPQSLCAAP